jgi:hypothetical protein
MRPWVISIIISLFVLIGIAAFIRWWTTPVTITHLSSQYKLIGLIDMEYEHGISLNGVKEGHDVLLLLDYNGFLNKYLVYHPEYQKISANERVVIKNYDINHNGIIDSESPLWPYLYIIYYRNNGTAYTIKPIAKAGIHAISLKHETAEGNHTVILSDDSERILYEKLGKNYQKFLP